MIWTFGRYIFDIAEYSNVWFVHINLVADHESTGALLLKQVGTLHLEQAIHGP